MGPGERAVVVILPGQEEAVQRRLGELAGHVAPNGAEASGVGRAVTTVPGLSGQGGVGRGGVGLGAGAAAPMERYVASKEQWLRCRGGGDHFDVVQSRISKASRMSTTPKGAGWKTSMASRVPMTSMLLLESTAS